MLRLNFSFSYGPGLVYQVLELFWIASVINSNIFCVSLPSIFIFFSCILSPLMYLVLLILIPLKLSSPSVLDPLAWILLCLVPSCIFCFHLSPFLLILRVLFPLACLLWLISPVFHSTPVCLHFPDCPSQYSGSYCILSSVPLTLPLNYCQQSHNKLFSLSSLSESAFGSSSSVSFWTHHQASVHEFWDHQKNLLVW